MRMEMLTYIFTSLGCTLSFHKGCESTAHTKQFPEGIPTFDLM